jgi:hypothetical protein
MVVVGSGLSVLCHGLEEIRAIDMHSNPHLFYSLGMEKNSGAGDVFVRAAEVCSFAITKVPNDPNDSKNASI